MRKFVALARCARGELRRQRGVAIGNGGQYLVIHFNKCCRVLGDVSRLRDHHGNCFADEGDLVAGEHEWGDVGGKRAGAKPKRHAFLGEHGAQIGKRKHRVHTRERARTLFADGADAGMGMGAAHKGRLQHAGKPQVVDEPARTGEQRPIFNPRDGYADRAALLHARAPGPRSGSGVACSEQTTQEPSFGATHAEIS